MEENKIKLIVGLGYFILDSIEAIYLIITFFLNSGYSYYSSCRRGDFIEL